MSETFIATDGTVVDLVDTDGDGYNETTLVDSNADGQTDAALIDIDLDGQDDVAHFDNNADGTFRPDVWAIDTTGDGIVDVAYDDLDFDGTYDQISHPGGFLADANPYGRDLSGPVFEVYAQD